MNNLNDNDLLSEDLKLAIKHMVANISKSFIVEWYTSISQTNHDFVASCETLIESALTKLAILCMTRLDKYKTGQLVAILLHDHIFSDNVREKIQSIESQIDNHEYDICQNSVIRLFGLLCNEDLRRVIFSEELVSNLTSDTNSSEDGSQQTSSRTNLDDGYDNNNRSSSSSSANNASNTKTTSALYTLVIAMLTKAVFMPLVNSITRPKWLYAVVIWLCKKEERERLSKSATTTTTTTPTTTNKSNTTGSGDKSGGIIRQLSNPSISNQVGGQTSIIVSNTRGYRSVDLEEGIDLASGSINFENPVCDSLKRPLDNIEIYATEDVKGNNSCYVLYCIRYDGLCQRHPSASGFNFLPELSEVPVIDKRTSNVTSRRLIRNEPCSSQTISHTGISNRSYFQRKMTIKRRFREFVILQLRLEENPKIRPYMKNIPKPTKLKAATQNIFSLPGITNIKLDQSTIKLRQRFLERFLTALNSSPFIANSYEFKEFFSYNVNTPSINITKSKSLILQVNLNKVFVDSVRSAMSIIRATLPGDDSYNLGTNPDPDAWLVELQQSTLKLHVQTRTSHSKMNLERLIDSKLLSMSSRTSSRSIKLRQYEQLNNYSQTMDYRRNFLIPELVKSHSLSSESSSALMSRSTTSDSRLDTTSSRSSSIESIYYDALDDVDEYNNSKYNCNSVQICDSIPIASKLIDIVHYSIRGDAASSASAISLLARLILGKTIERYAIRLLEAAFTLETATFSINGITSSIWDESDDPPLDMEHATLDEAVIQLTKLLERNFANSTFIPRQLLTSILSKQVRFYLSQLSSQRRNKYVVYAFFVQLLDELEADSTVTTST